VVLDNGIEVIAEEMRVSPLVSVSVLYKVGSRNEVSGHTGVSHFVEHMLFNGTEKYPGDESGRQILKHGGIPNGETYWDYTHFGGTVPSDQLDLVLDIEADRMANATVDSQAVEDERDIILEELAMRGEAPIVVLLEDLFSAAYKVHPYHHWYPGGYFGDVVRMTPSYVREFYRTYYQPSNTIITVVGNVDEDTAIRKVREYFEDIPAGPHPDQDMPEEPEQMGLRRVTVRGDAIEPRLMMFFKGPEHASRDYEVGTVLTMMLANGRSSYLTGEVVDQGLANELGLVMIPSIDPFGLLLIASVEPGGDLEACEKAIFDAVERFKSTEPDLETVRKARTRVEGLTILGRQTPRSRAFELATEAARGDWRYADRVVENMRTVTPEEIHDFARRYLRWDRVTIGWLIPKDSDLEDADLIGSAASSLLPMGILDGLRAAPGGMALTMADAEYVELPNGVTLILKEDHSLPIVSIWGQVGAGAAYDPPGKSGLAGLTAGMAAMGSREYPYDYLYDRIESLGSSLESNVGVERAFLGTTVLANHASEAAEIICDLLTDPALRSDRLKQARRELLSKISQREEDALEVGLMKFREHIYGDHPYANPPEGRRAEVEDLSIRDVRRFYDDTWSPEGAAVVVVGDFDRRPIQGLLSKRLTDWRNDPGLDRSIPEIPRVTGTARHVETLPEKRQVKIFWGLKGPAVDDPDLESFAIMNFIFGGGAFGSRLFDRIREEESLAYVVGYNYDRRRKPAASYIHLGTRPRNVGEAIRGVEQEIDLMKAEEVTDEEMELAKNFLKSIMPFRMQTYSQIGRQLLDLEFYDLPRDFYDTQPERLEKVTKDDVLRMAREYLDTENSRIVIVGAVDESLNPVRPDYGK
jgi:zinc protease